MGMGSLSTIALQQPRNVTVVVIDNGLYGETGAQMSHTVRTDLAAVAAVCGIADVAVVETETALDAFIERMAGPRSGPLLGVIKIAAGDNTRLVPLREGAHGKTRFREALGLAAE